jgi:hypothetical protein
MKELAVALSLGWRRWLCLTALIALLVLFLLGMPYLLEVWNRAIDWFCGVFAHINKPWEELTWFR